MLDCTRFVSQVGESVGARGLSHFDSLAVGFFPKQLGDDAQGVDFFLYAHQFLLFAAEYFKRISHIPARDD